MDVEFANIPLSHLLKPGPHTDQFWLATMPKKLKQPLTRIPGIHGQSVIGWGIRINEGLNWGVLLLYMLSVLLMVGVIVILYVIFTSDESSAFGLGAYLVAVIGVYSSYQYVRWKEEGHA